MQSVGCVEILKFKLGSEAQRNKAKEINYSSIILSAFFSVLFPQASKLVTKLAPKLIITWCELGGNQHANTLVKSVYYKKATVGDMQKFLTNC